MSGLLKRRMGWLIAALWLASAAAGLGALGRYSGTPAPPGQAPAQWPSGSALRPPQDQPIVLLFAHPHCPCTRASLAELERILARVPGRAKGYALFRRPRETPPGWARTDLWDRASAVFGLSVLEDEGGDEARRFGIATSGHVLVFSADGRKLFSGGITPSRGHEGDSDGKTMALAVLNGTDKGTSAAVYGCALFDDGDRDDQSQGRK